MGGKKGGETSRQFLVLDGVEEYYKGGGGKICPVG